MTVELETQAALLSRFVELCGDGSAVIAPGDRSLGEDLWRRLEEGHPASRRSLDEIADAFPIDAATKLRVLRASLSDGDENVRYRALRRRARARERAGDLEGAVEDIGALVGSADHPARSRIFVKVLNYYSTAH